MKKRSLLMASVLVLSLSLTLIVPVSAASGTVAATCEGAYFTGELAGGETGQLEIELHSDGTWYSPHLQNEIIPLPAGLFDVFVPWVTNPDGLAYRIAIRVDGTVIAVAEDVLDCPPPPEFEGCSPGYFKKHLEDWAATGYSPGDDFDTTFGVDYFDPDITLEEAVNAKGGGLNRLARHGTAGLLSAAHPDVNYPYTVAEVIAFVQAGDADPLAAASDLGCQIP